MWSPFKIIWKKTAHIKEYISIHFTFESFERQILIGMGKYKQNGFYIFNLWADDTWVVIKLDLINKQIFLTDRYIIRGSYFNDLS